MTFSTPFSLLLLLPTLVPLLPPISSLSPFPPSPFSPPSRHFWWNELVVRGGGRGEVGKNEVLAFTRAKEGLDRQGFRAYGPKPYLFVRFSAYRFSPNIIFVVGQTARVHMDAYPNHQIFSECLWIPGADQNDTCNDQNERSIVVVGTAKITRSIGAHGRGFEPAIVECKFAEKVGDGTGGLLFLQPAPVQPALRQTTDTSRPELSMHPMLVFHEKEYDSSIYEAEVPSYKYEYAHCGSPLYGTLLSNQIGEWYQYHYELLDHNVHFLVYNAGEMDTPMDDVFRPYVGAGHMTIVDVRQQSDYDSYLYSQVLFLNDCMHRARYLARWVFNFDTDEYLVVRPPQTLKALMKVARDKYWISFGTLIHDVGHCLTNRQPGEWKVEHMVYREEKPVCFSHTNNPYRDNEWGCEGVDGRRKWIINPRTVGIIQVHQVRNNAWCVYVSQNSSMHVNARQAWLGHYRHITSHEEFHCEQNVSNSVKDFVAVSKYGLIKKEIKYVYDRVIKDVAEQMRRLRDIAIANEKTLR